MLRRLDKNDPLLRSSTPTLPSPPRRSFIPLGRNPPPPPQGRRERLPLSPYEQKIVTEVVAPEDINVTFSSIGGLEDIIDELRESVIYPLTSPHLFAGHSTLLGAPKGVLLYGPPGCGKTMLAKALAKESEACFINLHISTLTEKWYGDSNKMVNAVFSLAKKLQPCIIFIDEIDAVLRQRSAQDHEASAMVKAEFMTHWDGLLTATPHKSNSGGGPTPSSTSSPTSSPDLASNPDDLSSDGTPRIMVLGATNRINDIDEAILRRLPKKFHIPLPDAAQRKRILQLVLHGTKLDPSFDFDELVGQSLGFSGSDLKEACRDAAMVPLRELIRRRRNAEGKEGENDVEQDDLKHPRGVRNSDFFRKESGGKVSADVNGLAAVMAAGIGLGGVGLPGIPRAEVPAGKVSDYEGDIAREGGAEECGVQ